MHPWVPAYHAVSAFEKHQPPPRPISRTGAFAASPLTPEQQQQQRALLDEFREGFRQITPALILTGLAIGITAGAGSSIGTAIGNYAVDWFRSRRKRGG